VGGWLVVVGDAVLVVVGVNVAVGGEIVSVGVGGGGVIVGEGVGTNVALGSGVCSLIDGEPGLHPLITIN